jgi:hypothetical protein
MTRNIQEFHCEHVSTSEAGDYVQVLFEKTPDADDEYLLIQRQFEFPDEGECYVETDDPDFCGHYHIQRAQLSRDRFCISYGNGPVKQVTVSFNAAEQAYAEAERTLREMIPELESA